MMTNTFTQVPKLFAVGGSAISEVFIWNQFNYSSYILYASTQIFKLHLASSVFTTKKWTSHD